MPRNGIDSPFRGLIFNVLKGFFPWRLRGLLLVAALGFASPSAMSEDQIDAFQNQWLKALQKNYAGPPLNGLTRDLQLTRFTIPKDGIPKWIYHSKDEGTKSGVKVPPHLSSEAASEAESERKMQSAMSDAVRASKSCPKLPADWSYPLIVEVNHFKQDRQPFSLWVMDYPGEIDCLLTPKTVTECKSNPAAQKIADQIMSRLKPAVHADSQGWSAVFFDLYPDDNIGELKTVTVLSGRTNTAAAKANAEVEKRVAGQLKAAIAGCKTLPYKGITSEIDEPVGLLAIYHAQSVPPLIIDKFIFTRDPNYVILRKK